MKAFAVTSFDCLAKGVPPSVGGLLFPLFGDRASPYVAEYEGANDEIDGTVSGFRSVSLDEDCMLPLPINLSADYAPGDAYPFAYECVDGRVHLGAYPLVCEAVRGDIANYTGRPFTVSSLAHFLRDRLLAERALDECAALMEAIRAGSGQTYKEMNPISW